ncbi:PREDICTED: pentatricopeptide repeat-containing protein At4g14050, mitochondrial [Fragaria vesca subsp. vesca]|uniref:pentatricopeptide repeat-containing protein At4g14050, mitochondrial n=1 Tax=Fragaria vesca subsp. vesca TaxID=101020 RepID=UPI0002C360CC|nr:PREDICTED: pentatricopeptide repeat-containing protein At4g14050, mitochondrial [Fragaria vesca subsp. vesca]
MPVSRYLHQLKLCARNHTPSTAKTLHAQLIKTALHQCVPLPNTLLHVYAKCGLLQDALHLFDEMPHRDHVTWASLLTALNQANLSHRTLSIFPTMFQSDSLLPDHFVFASLVKACSSLGALRQGKQVHARFMLSPFCGDDVAKSSLVDMYVKCGLPDNARAVFDSSGEKSVVAWTALVSGYARSGRKKDALEMFGKMPVKSLFSWTALISGLVQSGNGVDALYLFIEMRRERVDIVDPLVLSSTVGACANLAVLELGKQVHGLVIRLGYGSCLFVSNALVDMYAKCSDILAARDIFGGMQRKDVVSWTSIIVGAAQHGRAVEALTLYDGMVEAGIKPNEVTFVGLIYACSHVGFVSKGRAIFRSMIEDYGIRPCLQHYTCFLDLLSRSGHLVEALNVISSMPFEPDEPTWAALLSACKHHGDTQMGIRVADHLLSLNPEDPSSYILLSNVYAGAGMWQNVAKVRTLMTEREVKKNPGYSSIDVGKESQVFYAGETSHPLKDDIFGLLKELDAEMRKRGYVPDSSFVLHDMEQQEKERQLFWHSERLALAYGLLKAVPGTPIRIVKNLRVCGDCHTVLKFISSIVKRDIIVRDATRYHHFSKGECSCNDFW